MQIKHSFQFVSTWLRKIENKTVLAWLLGLLLGTWIGVYPVKPDPSGMFCGFISGASFSGMVSTAVLPFLIAAYAACSGRVFLLPPLCFFKAFVFSFSGCTIFHIYGSAGWLIRFLFAFSDICSMPVLYWFCMRSSRQKGFRSRELLACTVLVLLFVFLNYFVISPFLAEMI